MKTLLVIVALGALGYFFWQKSQGGGSAADIEDPVYAEMRMSVTIMDREIDAVLFGRMPGHAECEARGNQDWAEVFESCPTCELQPAVCHDELEPRYARLFDDEPIPSAYLSLTAGAAGERDGRLVVYGLTDAEGKAICEGLRKGILKKYRGTGHCVLPADR